MTTSAVVPAPSVAFRAAVSLYSTQWLRSRAPLGFLVFVAVFCWFDYATLRENGASWSAIILFLASWTAFLAGYDTYERLRTDGSLRLMLLHAVPRQTIVVAFVSAGWLVSTVATLVCLGYLIVGGRVPSLADVGVALPQILLGVAVWVSYSQALSLVLPRDSAAVLGIIGLIFGSFPSDRWLPVGTPGLVQDVVAAIWWAVPSSLRLADAVSGTRVAVNTLVMALHLVIGIGAGWALLSRRSLLARRAHLP